MFGKMLAIEHPFDTMPPMDPSTQPTGIPSGRARDRRVFLGRRALAAIALAVMAGPWLGPLRQAVSGPAAPVPVSRDTYLVRAGDTLWAIAERLSPGADPRPLVDAIAEANDLDARRVEAGTTLVIPLR